MFARAVEDHKLTSSQHKLSTQPVQQTLDFRGAVKRKALDVIDDMNKRVIKDVTPVRGTGLIAALANTDSFVETGGQVMIDREVFDEADFDDIGMSDWEAPLKSGLPTKEITPVANKPVVVEAEEDYFKDDDLDWDVPLNTVGSSPPVASDLPTAQPKSHILPHFHRRSLRTKNTFPHQRIHIQSPNPITQETYLPLLRAPPMVLLARCRTSTRATSKTYPPLGHKPQSVTAELQKPNHMTSRDRNLKSNPLSEREKSRGISTMATEHSSVDWDILGITERTFLRQQKRERMENYRGKMKLLDVGPNGLI